MMLMPLIAFKMKTKMRFYLCNFLYIETDSKQIKITAFRARLSTLLHL